MSENIYDYPCEDLVKPKKLENDNGQGSILKEILKSIKPGTPFHSITLPAFILKPVSLLETLTTNARPNSILQGVENIHASEMRMAKITAWIISSWKHVAQEGVSNSKPYNPILGEIFQCHWNHKNDQSRTNYIAEQVSHHPPRSAFYSYNPQRGTLYKGWVEPYTSLGMNSAGTTLVGKFSFSLVKLGEEYQIKFPTVNCNGILFGKSYIEMADKLVVSCKKTKLVSSIKFKGNEIKGYVVELDKKKKKKLMKIHGVIHDEVFIQSCVTKKQLSLYKVKEIVADPMQVRPLSEQYANESRKNWHKLTLALHQSDYQNATKEKNEVENRERAIRKKRTTPHVPKLFELNQKTNDWEYIYASHDWTLAKLKKIYSLTENEAAALSKIANVSNEDDLIGLKGEVNQKFNDEIKKILLSKKSKIENDKEKEALIGELIQLTLV